MDAVSAPDGAQRIFLPTSSASALERALFSGPGGGRTDIRDRARLATISNGNANEAERNDPINRPLRVLRSVHARRSSATVFREAMHGCSGKGAWRVEARPSAEACAAAAGV